MNLAAEGLMLGIGTVLAPAEGARRLTSLDGQEVRVLALLSAAYGKAVASAVPGKSRSPLALGAKATIAAPTFIWRIPAFPSCKTPRNLIERIVAGELLVTAR